MITAELGSKQRQKAELADNTAIDTNDFFGNKNSRDKEDGINYL
jgi:hypothetical protein